MKKLFGIIVALIVLGAIFSGNDNAPKKQSVITSQSSSPVSRSVPVACDTSTAITGKKYNVLGSGINVRKGPGASYEKIINQKATSILKTTQYISIDDTTTVFEECTKDGWSWIRVIDPDWPQDSHRGWVESKFLDKGKDIGGDKYARKISSSAPSPYTKKGHPKTIADSHRGWVANKFLDKGQDIGGDKYARKISSSALSPYTKKGYPKTIAKYGSRLSEIESLRRKAAEMAVDSGKCDYVLMSELSDNKSSLNHLHFWVDCLNMQRIYLDEFQIKKGSRVLSEEEKSWDKTSARTACQQAIKDRALIPSEVEIHTILGTSFYKAPITHNVVLRMDFDAKNVFGTEIPYTATCHFKPGEVGTIDIQPRQ
uniref:SH3 domain-containing protein n=1 Tax=Candidatus Kentrum sp. DK TaxID=2126562 RepID=A0A450S8W8_9GAMM|nr:MAG: hypothetical protein BECKDK2373B_GA0170837_102035 [Candidatus Kentron sp. DK]